MSEREQIIPMRGMPVAQAEESEADGYEGRGRFFCALPATPPRVFPPGVIGPRLEAINMLGNKWTNGTVLRFYFFDRQTDGENVLLQNGSRVWRSWVGPEAQRQVVRQLARAHGEAVPLVERFQVHHGLAAVAALAVHVLKQMQRERAGAVEQQHVAFLQVQKVAGGQVVDQPVELAPHRRR